MPQSLGLLAVAACLHAGDQMRLQATVQEGVLALGNERASVWLEPLRWK